MTATDLSAEMLAALGRRAHREGVGNVELRVMDAEDLRFPDGSFDVALAAFVIMFCPDSARAAAVMRRMLRPGGRFALAVWDEAGRNPFFGAIARPLEAFLPPRPPPDPRAPGSFRLAPPGELESALRAGGLTDVRVECVPFTMECDCLDHVWEIQTAFAPPLRAAIGSLAEAERDRLREAAAGGTTPYLRDGRLRFPAAALCACGQV